MGERGTNISVRNLNMWAGLYHLMGFLEASSFLLCIFLEEMTAFTFSICRQNNILRLLVDYLHSRDVLLLVLLTVVRGSEVFFLFIVICVSAESASRLWAVDPAFYRGWSIPQKYWLPMLQVLPHTEDTTLGVSPLIVGLNFLCNAWLLCMKPGSMFLQG